jgi:hypothetical protein
LRFGPSPRFSLPAAAALVLGLWGCSVAPPAPDRGYRPPPGPADLAVLEDRVQSWRLPRRDDELRGLRLLYDTPVPGGITLSLLRSATRANHRLDPFDALVFATYAIQVAGEHHLDPGFFGATLLQESGFQPDILSPAGAVGIAQFTFDTADDVGIDPFDWADSMRGAGSLLGRYVAEYDGAYADPYAVTLAAYNAGPGTVAYYHGVPPYAETRGYVADIYDRWARLLRDAYGLPVRKHRRKRKPRDRRSFARERSLLRLERVWRQNVLASGVESL